MDAYITLRQQTRCPECAEIMEYREATDDWLCLPCDTEFTFSMGRWFSCGRESDEEYVARVRANTLVLTAFDRD